MVDGPRSALNEARADYQAAKQALKGCEEKAAKAGKTGQGIIDACQPEIADARQALETLQVIQDTVTVSPAAKPAADDSLGEFRK